MNPSLDSLLADYGHVDVVAIRYHGDFPWEFDPFYSANPAEIDARYAYYAITQMPTTIIDGSPIPKTCFIEEIRNAIDQDLEDASPINLAALGSVAGDSCFVSVQVIAEGDTPAGQLVLRAAVIEDSICYEAPNGQTVLNSVFRSFLPGPGGTGFSISQGETLDFELAGELDPSWGVSGISTVVFVQDDAEKRVLQAVSTKPRPAAWARYRADVRGRVLTSGHSYSFPGTFINRGPEPDTFDVYLPVDLPGDWAAHVDVCGGDTLTDAVVLDSDSSCTVVVTINSGLEAGTGYAAARLASRRDTVYARSLDFFAVAGICALVVDDDGGHDLEPYYEASLDSVGVVWGRWDRRVAEPAADDLGKSEFVVWFTGETAPTLDAGDRQVISAYLDGGGSLFLTGQDIGYALCDIISDEYSPQAKSFYEAYLHASYVMSNSNLFDLSGRPGDPVSDGLSITIEGGDGADNQRFPDVIDSIAPARTIFDYSDPLKHGGIRYDSGTYKIVYLSFGFEAVSEAADRNLLMSRIVGWFGQIGGIDDLDSRTLLACYPNPATTHARIVMTPAGFGSRIEIYDVLGRLVREVGLRQEDQFVWDLKDAQGRKASPGVYFITARSGGETAASKIILTP